MFEFWIKKLIGIKFVTFKTVSQNFFVLSCSFQEKQGFVKSSFALSNYSFYGILDGTFNVTTFLATLSKLCVQSKKMPLRNYFETYFYSLFLFSYFNKASPNFIKHITLFSPYLQSSKHLQQTLF